MSLLLTPLTGIPKAATAHVQTYAGQKRPHAVSCVNRLLRGQIYNELINGMQLHRPRDVDKACYVPLQFFKWHLDNAFFPIEPLTIQTWARIGAPPQGLCRNLTRTNSRGSSFLDVKLLSVALKFSRANDSNKHFYMANLWWIQTPSGLLQGVGTHSNFDTHQTKYAQVWMDLKKQHTLFKGKTLKPINKSLEWFETFQCPSLNHI